MTGYYLQVGYNSSAHGEGIEHPHNRLLAIVAELRQSPERILAEVKRVEGRDIPPEYAESYRPSNDDLTVRIALDEHNCPFVAQAAGGGGESRDYKEAMRRAFCRLVVEAMHRERIEVSMIVS